MAIFTNQAQLSYGDVTTSSNVAVGEILEALSISKTAIPSTYTTGDSIAYVINIVNSSSTPITGLSVSDDLGAYQFNETSLVPLTYVDDSAKYFINGVLQPSVDVNVGTEIVFSGIDVPANGNVAIVYSTTVNDFAPVSIDGFITNTVRATGAGITPIEASETIYASATPNVSITKSISPIPVAPNGLVAYTFVIENRGVAPLDTTDNAVITDLFDPILRNINVVFNSETWSEGVNYTYDEATGEFATVPGQVTVAGASYAQDPTTGVWALTPGTSTIVITGNIG